MRDSIFMVITDLHYDIQDLEQTQSVVIQAVDKAVVDGIGTIFIAGDIFNSRKSQYLEVLLAFKAVLKYANDAGVRIIAIPGNHDKLDYQSESSYLDVFKDVPGFTLVDRYSRVDINNWNIHLVPFFDEKTTYSKYLNLCVLDNPDNVLITHVAVDGVRNNDGSVVDDVLDPTDFNAFFKVLVGHYHDKQQVGTNIFYVGSIRQRNYGEDDLKGFTIFYNDGSHELFIPDFQRYKTVKIDLDKTDIKQVQTLAAQYANSKDNIRFKFQGSAEKVKSIDKHIFESVGIDVKIEQTDVEVHVDYQSAQNFDGFDRNKILDEWKEFADNNPDIDKETGEKLLKKVL